MSFVYNALNNVPVTNVKTVVFTSNGTYTPPANLRTAVFFLQGAGGGAGGAEAGTPSNTWSFGGGGSGGRFGQVTIQAADISGPVDVTVGVGGAGGNGANAGADGGNTQISSGVATRLCRGGVGGDAPHTVPAGGYRCGRILSPTANSGTFDWEGAPTSYPSLCLNRITTANTKSLFQCAGSAAFGGGGALVVRESGTLGTGVQGVNANALGSGGCSGFISQPSGAANRTGGTGGNGIVIVYEFLAEAP